MWLVAVPGPGLVAERWHWPAEDGTPLEEYWQVFTDLRSEGKIHAAGLSNHGIFRLEAAEEIGVVDAIQALFNLIHREAADDVLLWARVRAKPG